MKAKLLRAVRRVRDKLPLTWLGFGVGVLSAASLYVGITEQDLILTGAGLVGLVAVAMDLSILVAALIRVRVALSKMVRSESTHVLECGYEARTGFQLPRLGWLPGVRVTWSWLKPAAPVRVVRVGGFFKGYLEEEVRPVGRGWTEELHRRIDITAPVGLASVTLDDIEERPVRMLPSVGGLRSMHVVRTLSGGSDIPHPDGTPEGDRLDLRHYAPGDPIKFVLWNVFARTREMVVRTPERALEAAKKTLAYLVAGNGDEPAAGAARVAVDVGALGGDWAFGADGVPEHATNKESALEALARSAHAGPNATAEGLARFVKQAAAESSGRAVVFVPARPGPWLDGVVEAAKSMPADARGRVPLEFMVCTDGVEKASKVTALRRLAFHDKKKPKEEGLAAVENEDLQKVVATLGSLGARIIVLDRRDGHVHMAAGR